MRYTLTLLLGELPTWAQNTVLAGIEPYVETRVLVSTSLTPDGAVLSVTGPGEAVTREVLSVVLARVGKTIEDVVIDLFA
jgi:hypothetical protein